jgi:methylated-DNA-protein-cysteine methyltransferase related protein
MPPLFDRIYATVARIPPGHVSTYGDIALHLGMPHGARTVGWAMRQCPGGLPWHRVVNAQGKSSLHGEGRDLQYALLAEEGVIAGMSGRIDLDRYRWQEI